ncbi:hypothetical protein ABW19_dt0207457 [Dactylella cylindrospora]|nr:hypothetical protein ABW19_dt0207457 [Dactylella cylindrospora]
MSPVLLSSDMKVNTDHTSSQISFDWLGVKDWGEPFTLDTFKGFHPQENEAMELTSVANEDTRGNWCMGVTQEVAALQLRDSQHLEVEYGNNGPFVQQIQIEKATDVTKSLYPDLDVGLAFEELAEALDSTDNSAILDSDSETESQPDEISSTITEDDLKDFSDTDDNPDLIPDEEWLSPLTETTEEAEYPLPPYHELFPEASPVVSGEGIDPDTLVDGGHHGGPIENSSDAEGDRFASETEQRRDTADPNLEHPAGLSVGMGSTSTRRVINEIIGETYVGNVDEFVRTGLGASRKSLGIMDSMLLWFTETNTASRVGSLAP